MSKILILADLHLDNHAEFAKVTIHQPTRLPINSRLNDTLVVLRRVIQSAHDTGVRHLIVAGDIYHKRVAVPTAVQQFTYELFRWAVKELEWEVYLMTGNHDQLDRAGHIHSLYNLQDICTVIDTTEEHDIGGANVAFLPYMEDTQDTIHCLARAGLNDPVDLFVCHTGVEGAFVGSTEYRIKHPITLADIDADRFRWVILGHYHKPQKLSRNVLYAGSPAQVNRAESGDAKRYLVYDTETHKMRSYPTGAKEFRLVTDEEFLGLSDSERARHYYDITTTGQIDAKILHNEIGDSSVKIIRPKIAKVADKRIELTETMSDWELLTAYTFHKGAHAKWVSLGYGILNKVSQVTCPYSSLKVMSMIVHNFMGISHAKLNLNRPGQVTSILGLNHSRPGYISNGAGKSSLLPEAPFWCLFGETARDLPVDKVVNRFAKRDCYVKILLRLDNDKLVVTRFRKYKKLGGTGLRLELNGIDITEGTPSLTETKLASLLGIGYVTFASTIAFSPDNLAFVSSTDASQKQVLDSILQTRRFSAALVVAKSIQSELTTSKLNDANSLETTNGLLDSAKDTQKDYERGNEEFQNREQVRVESLKIQLANLDDEASETQEQIEFSSEELIAAKEKTQELVDSAPPKDEIDTQYREALKENAEANSELKSLRQQRLDIQAKLDAALEQAGKPCPTCGVPVANTGKLIANFQHDRNRLTKAIAQQELLVVSLQEAEDALDVKLDEASEHANSIGDARREEARVSRVKSDHVNHLVNINKSRSSLIKSIETPPQNDYVSLLSHLALKVANLEIDRNTFLQSISKIEKQLLVIDFWVQAFGVAGIRSFLLDQILPDLTQYANEFSEVLTGGGTLIEFSSYNEDTMKDKFRIQAWTEDGSDIYQGNSSGEKRRVDICVMFALFRISHSRTNINVVLLDEVLDTLDGYGLELVPEVLEKLARELNLSVYVTSHTSLNDMIPNSIVVEKRDGLSTLKEVEYDS